MLHKIILSPILIFSLITITSCSQNDTPETKIDAPIETKASNETKYQEPHTYGGWYCPDNFGGFPPMDIQDYDKIDVVVDRLPTLEETRNGTSLMYIDTTKYPDARPLELDLPKVARIYSHHNGLNELIIVIQATIVQNDTVVGFRYPNGGNGSAWFGEVTFLSDEETESIGPAPMVYKNLEINASKAEIWKTICATDYAETLGERFDQQSFFKSDWTDRSEARFDYESNDLRATGFAADMWGNLYLHIDYDYQGFHYSEKLFITEKEDNVSELIIASGPYPDDFDTQNALWENWGLEVKRLSEKK